jgi:hypothetical protein
MADNYDSGILSDGTFYWWHGQIVDDSTWRENIPSKGTSKADNPGFGYRYKVRVMGQHTPDKKKLPDENLPMAEVLLPVTAGSGIQGSSQTPNLSQGDFVIGFFKDGLKRNEPIILGSYSTGAQTKLNPEDPKQGFIPRTGYKGKSGDKKVHRKDQLSNPGLPREGMDVVSLAPASNLDKVTDDAIKTNLENNCEKKNSEVKGIQTTVQNLLKAVNQAKQAAASVQGALGQFNLAAGPDFLKRELAKSTQIITQFVKNIMVRIRGYISLKVTNTIKDVTTLIQPNKRQILQAASEAGGTTLYCAMEKVINSLSGIINKLLQDLIDKFINGPLCAIEKFLGDLLGNILGPIIGAITSVLDEIGSIIGSVTGAISGIINAFMSALNIASNVLSFFSCDTEQQCPGYDGWTLGSGAFTLPSPSEALGTKLAGLMPNIPGGDSAPPCNTSGIPCGPPKLEFVGDSLKSASGNLIVNQIGAIIGVDLTGSGSGYTSPPLAVVTDPCGIGKGAVLQTQFDPLYTGPPFTPITAGGDGGTPLVAGGIGGIPVTTPDGTPVTAGATGGTPVVAGVTSTITPVTAGGTPVTAGTDTGNQTPITTTSGIPLTIGGTGGTPVTAGTDTGNQTPITTTSGIPLTIGGTGGTPVYAGGTGGIPVITPNGTSVTAGGDGGTSVTSITGIPIVVSTPLGGVTSVEVIDSGFDYLSAPNGSVGGNGDIFANNTDGIYTSPSGSINSYLPGTTIDVVEGGTLGLPAGSAAEIYDNEGNLVQTIVGAGLLSPTTIDFGGQIYNLYESLIDGNLGNIPPQNSDKWLPLSKDFENLSVSVWNATYAYYDGNVVKYDSGAKSGTTTIPGSIDTNITVIGQSSSLSSGNTYPVILSLEKVVIDDPGYLYDPSDNIFITPSNGTELQVEYDKFGRVSKVNVITKGYGFTDIPEIGIISLTGYNAELRPILRPTRVKGGGEELPIGADIISVVDCVGKV